jgi:hypothetical protein
MVHPSYLAFCVVAGLAGLNPCRSAKLPSWHGPDVFFEGSLPSKRLSHGFASCDNGKLYVFGGNNIGTGVTGELDETLHWC